MRPEIRSLSTKCSMETFADFIKKIGIVTLKFFYIDKVTICFVLSVVGGAREKRANFSIHRRHVEVALKCN